MDSLLKETIKRTMSVAENIRTPSEKKLAIEEASPGFLETWEDLPAYMKGGGYVKQGGNYSFRGGATILEESYKDIVELEARYEDIPDITVENPVVTATKIPIIDRSPLEIIPGYPTSVTYKKDPLTEEDIFTAATEGYVKGELTGSLNTGEVGDPGENEIIIGPTIPGLPDLYNQGKNVSQDWKTGYEQTIGPTIQNIYPEIPDITIPNPFEGIGNFFSDLGNIVKIGVIAVFGIIAAAILIPLFRKK